MRARIVVRIFGLLLVGLSLPASTRAAESLTGKVVKVADGDTLTLLVDREQTRSIRLPPRWNS